MLFHTSILCDKTFPWVPLFFTLWPWPWSLTHFLKTLTMLITFEQWVLELWYFTWVFLVLKTFPCFHYFLIIIIAFILHMSISYNKIFLLVSRYLSLWLWPSLELAILGGICVSQTHLVIFIIKIWLWISKYIRIRQQVMAYISLLHKCYFQSCQIKTFLHIKRCDFC